MNKKYNEPAFPSDGKIYTGLTKLEYFTAQIASAYFANYTSKTEIDPFHPEIMASLAADLLDVLNEREN